MAESTMGAMLHFSSNNTKLNNPGDFLLLVETVFYEGI